MPVQPYCDGMRYDDTATATVTYRPQGLKLSRYAPGKWPGTYRQRHNGATVMTAARTGVDVDRLTIHMLRHSLLIVLAARKRAAVREHVQALIGSRQLQLTVIVIRDLNLL